MGADRLTITQLRQLYDQLGIPEDWQAFLLATAHRESRFSPAAINRGDAGAAKKAWERNAAKYQHCDPDPDRWTIGAVGLYQFLPASGMEAFRGTAYECEDPIAVLTDPRLATIAAIAYAKRVMRWKAWSEGPQTWTALAAAWASPSLARSPSEKYRTRLRKHLDAVGADPDLADRPVTPPPEIAA